MLQFLPNYYSSIIRSFIVVLIAGGGSFAQTTETFITPGNGTWEVPCGVTSINIELWGGGGAGGGSTSNGSGGGGGGGGCYFTTTHAVVPGSTLSYTVGAGGVGSLGNGTAGGFSAFDGYIAPGGSGGLANAGGFGAGCTPAQNGTNGGASGGNGGPGQNGGAGGAGVINGAGQPGTAPGGGGGGGEKQNPVNYPGGAGGNGQILITYTTSVTVPNAGTDISGSCGPITLSGNTPDAGWTGTWVLVSGEGTIDSPNDPNSGVSGVTPNTCSVFEWQFSQAGCATFTDPVSVCIPSGCNDEPCTAAPLTVTNVTPGTGCAPTVNLSNSNSTFSSGMPEPPCGYVNGPDVWYSVVVPADGQLQVNATDNNIFDVMVSIYEGTCSDLSAAGCVNGSGSNVFPLTYTGVPGSTIYIRVNEYLGGDSPTGPFGLCVYSASTATVSDILPGDTTVVSCGSTLNFYDPGGQGGTPTTSTLQPPPAGNYTNNTGAQYTICPSDPSQYVEINFTQFAIETGFDKVIILAGDTVIAQWTGTQGAGDIVTSQYPGECLTVVFQADYIYTAMGWEALVSCTTAVVTPQITNGCEVRNCTEGCGVWICADGIYDTEAGAGAGIDEINEVTGGCWGAAGEVATSWFYFTVAADGDLAFEFVPSNSGHNLNFALYGPSTDGVPPCPLITGESPVRCSFANIGGANTGMQAGETDLYEGADGNSFVAPLDVQAGETYALVVDVYQNGQPPTQTQIDFTGAATLDCAVVPLGVSWLNFSGINQDDQNLLTWITASETNNDYYTIERSRDGKEWIELGEVDGAGNTNRMIYYSFIDYDPLFPFGYYRLKQTDFDGVYSYSKTITISREKLDGNFVSKIFPNPAEEYFSFMYNGTNYSSPLVVSVVDNTGKTCYQMTFDQLQKNGGMSVSTDSLSSGVYQILFTQGDRTEIQKLSIIK